MLINVYEECVYKIWALKKVLHEHLVKKYAHVQYEREGWIIYWLKDCTEEEIAKKKIIEIQRRIFVARSY